MSGTISPIKYTLPDREKMAKIPGTPDWIKAGLQRIQKRASEEQSSDDFDKNGKIPAIENAFDDPIEKKVAYMIATSHEYKKPNVKAALSFVKNYKWELSTAKVSDLQGINKPIIPEKVKSMAEKMKGKTPEPLICINQFHGIRPQTPGKKILMDGHHRLEACKVNGVTEVPIYKGIYDGGAEKSTNELREKTAGHKEEIYKVASTQKKQHDPYRTTKTLAIANAIGVPTDLAFDLTSESVDVLKQGRRAGLGLKQSFKTPEAKTLFKNFVRRQKGFNIPASMALAALPIIPVYFSDRKKAKTAEDYKDEIYKAASEQVLYHASPVQDIKKFKRFEDTSGNNKGKIIFATQQKGYAAAFGTRWNDGIASLELKQKGGQKNVVTNDNFDRAILKATDEVNLDKPASLYKLRGDFKPMRYPDDLEQYTDKDVDIISEEKYKSFRDMAKELGLEIRPVGEKYIDHALKQRKSIEK